MEKGQKFILQRRERPMKPDIAQLKSENLKLKAQLESTTLLMKYVYDVLRANDRVRYAPQISLLKNELRYLDPPKDVAE